MTSSDDLSTALSNQACGSVLAETLARLGLRHVVHSPGSRSTPIVLACADHPRLELLPLLDERSAGFFALGLAKRSQAPVALVCTSGTAAANLYPAVIEANLSQAPLLLLTADRPPELRECRAGQAIDQTKLYGSQVRHFHELGLPEFTSAHLAYLRQTLVHAVNLATGRNPGAVHLNLPFREPFFSDEDGPNPPMPKGFDSEVFFQQIRPPVPARSACGEVGGREAAVAVDEGMVERVAGPARGVRVDPVLEGVAPEAERPGREVRRAAAWAGREGFKVTSTWVRIKRYGHGVQ